MEIKQKIIRLKNIVPFVTMIGEDFCHFANKVPGAFFCWNG